MAQGMVGVDLVTESGRFEALKTQGIIIGMKMAVDEILRPLTEREENDNSGKTP